MSTQGKYLRFNVSDRLEHWGQMLSFTILGLTGLVQKFSSSPLAVDVIAALGGIENVRVVHRVAASIMMLGAIYHLGAVGYKLYVKRARPSMLPTLRDVRVAWETLLYNLGRKDSRPLEGHYTFGEKFEYWAFVWGAVIMGLTGFMLWNPISTTRFLPGVVIPAAKAAHSAEALLAVLAIVIWHFYHVHIKHLNKSMFSGYLSEEEMREEHPLELAAIEVEANKMTIDPAEEAQRRRIFFPVFSGVAAAMLLGMYFFIRGEETALTTVPPAENVVVFAPYTPTPLPTPLPTPTPAPVSSVTWNGGIAALLMNNCGQCHNQTALGGLDLSNYPGALAGGQSGPAIVPGDPDASLLVARQTAGGHPGQLGSTELKLVIDWIRAGAPED